MKTQIKSIIIAIALCSFYACNAIYTLNGTNLSGNWDVIQYTDKTTTPATVTDFTPGSWTWTFDANGGFVIGSTNCTYTINSQESITLVISSASSTYTVVTFNETQFEFENSTEKYKLQR